MLSFGVEEVVVWSDHPFDLSSFRELGLVHQHIRRFVGGRLHHELVPSSLSSELLFELTQVLPFVLEAIELPRLHDRLALTLALELADTWSVEHLLHHTLLAYLHGSLHLRLLKHITCLNLRHLILEELLQMQVFGFLSVEMLVFQNALGQSDSADALTLHMQRCA